MTVALYILGITAYMAWHLPYHWIIFTFFVIGALLLIINNRFYLFLAAKRGRFFALAAVPFHLLYHLYNGFSFVAGIVHYSWRHLFEKKVEAPAEVDGRLPGLRKR